MNYSSTLPLTSNRLSKFDRVRVDVAQTGFFEGYGLGLQHGRQQL